MTIRHQQQTIIPGGLLILVGVFVAGVISPVVHAAPVSESGTVTISAEVQGTAPTIPAVITSPQDGSTVTTTPLVVSGTCQPTLEVVVYSNGAVAGTGYCAADGTFVINIGLLEGQNQLTALNYDTFGRAGPVSPTVTVYVRPVQPVTPSTPSDRRSAPAGIHDDTEQSPASTPAEDDSNESIPQKIIAVLRLDSVYPTPLLFVVLWLLLSSFILFLCIDVGFLDARYSRRVRNKLRSNTPNDAQ